MMRNHSRTIEGIRAAAVGGVLLVLAGASPLRPVVAAHQDTSAGTPAARPAFEVVSVRRNASGTGSSRISGRQGAFVATNVTLQALILSSYGIREDELLGGPDWIRTDRFDVEARGGADGPPEVLSLMVRTLLEDRFRLTLNREQRERDVYTLALARSDGRLGPNLLRMDGDCEARRRAGEPVAPLQPRPAFGPDLARSGSAWSAATCAPISSLSTALQRILQTTVIDDTGLDGRWDYILTYNPGGLPRLASLPVPAGPPPPSDVPSLFIALQEQLGLKVERRRGMVDVLVITSVQPPSEN